MPDGISVVYEDNHLLVLNKPPLLATMGAEPGQESLLDRAKDYIARKYQKPGNVYLGVVSRIDSFVTGVIVFARTSKAASRLSEQFRNNTVDKTYWAILPAGLASDQGELTHWVYKNEARRRMEAVAFDENGIQPVGSKVAKLSYKKLSEFNKRWLVEVKLETGRKHQIRVQFAAMGCPIVGDVKYGSDLTFKKGIALHAKELQLSHPTLKNRQSFSVEPPPWWRTERFKI